MSVVAAGPLFSVSALLGVAGAAKVARPDRTGAALATVGLRWSGAVGRVAGRLVGLSELALAAAAIWFGSRPLAVVVAAIYVGFAAFTLRLIARSGGQADCGCFGARQDPATQLHVMLNLSAGSLAALAAADPPGSLRSVLSAQPLAGVPFLALVVLCTWLGYLCFTGLGTLGQAVRQDRASTEAGR